MLKQRLPRFLALLGTTAVTASLIGVAVVGTGAYFTEVVGNGAINATTGSVDLKVNGSDTDAPTINFDNLMPGTPQTTTVSVQNTGTGTEDVYLVFDNANGAWSGVNTLGAYGTFIIDGVTYDNLNNKYAWGTDSSGQIISNIPSSGCYNVSRPAQIKFLPHYIKVAEGLTTTASKSFDISFGLHACMTSPLNELTPSFGVNPLNFSVVAFQAGVDPTSQLNGAGKIVPLPLGVPTPNAVPGTYQDR